MHVPVPRMWLCPAWKRKCGMEERQGDLPSSGARLWLCIPHPSLAGCATLGKSPEPSAPLVSHLEHRSNSGKGTCPGAVGRISTHIQIIHVKHSEHGQRAVTALSNACRSQPACALIVQREKQVPAVPGARRLNPSPCERDCSPAKSLRLRGGWGRGGEPCDPMRPRLNTSGDI